MPINIDDKILDFVYVLAMRDATQQKAFNASDKKDLWEDKTARAQIIGLLKNHISNIITGKYKNQQSYDSDFDILAKAINSTTKSQFSYSIDFEFGNCQKLINMFVKFIYITTYKQSTLKENFEYCHCPMDSIMLKDVWNKNDSDLKNLGYKRDDFLCSWSKEKFSNHKRYDEFQNQIRKLSSANTCCPIEYDYIIW